MTSKETVSNNQLDSSQFKTLDSSLENSQLKESDFQDLHLEFLK